ncbi:MAG: GtrA family protein [Methylobacter sp.]
MTTFLRYGIVAGLAYGIDFGGFIFLFGLGYSPALANVSVKVMAAIFGFFAHRYFTYSIKERDDIGKHAVKYFGLALFYTPTSTLFLYSIIVFLPNPVYAKAASDISLFILMYWITSKFAFTTAKEKAKVKVKKVKSKSSLRR